MGGIFSDESAAGPSRKYAAYLTREEEVQLEAVFLDGNVESRLNRPPSFQLVDKERDLVNVDNFLRFVIKLLRTSHRETTELVWNAIQVSAVDDHDVSERTREYFKLLIRTSVPEAMEQQQDIIESVAFEMGCFVEALNQGTTLTPSAVLRFCDTYLSFHEGLLKTYFMRRLAIPPSQSFVAFAAPELGGKSDIVSGAQMLFLGLHARLAQGEWMRLYSTAEDGYDFENLRNNIVGYQGPTVFIIKTSGKEVFGAFCAATWRETGDSYFGSNKSFLFTIHPHIRIYRSNPSARETQQYFNTRGYARDLHGLGLGKGTGKEGPYSTGLEHRLFIPKSMNDCYAAPSCNSFEAGPLLGDTAGQDGTSSSSFQVDVMEVWGSGGEEVLSEALAGLEDKRAQKRRVQERARKVDRAAFFENDFDQEMFLGSTFQHRKQMEQR